MGHPPARGQRAEWLEDHWRWRPEWATDRPMLWWYLTFEGQSPLRSLGNRIRRHLHEVPAVDVVPHRWLHLTIQEVGFVDEVAPRDVRTLVAATTDALADLPAQELTLGPVTTMRSAVVLAQSPVDHLRRLRTRLRETMSSSGWPVPGPEGLRPHVSLGYLNRDCDPGTVMDGLQPVRDLRTTVHVLTLTLAAVTRENRHYQWAAVAEFSLDRTSGEHAMAR